MDADLVREKLRLIVCLTAEIQAMLPEEPSRPYLALVKDGDYDIGDDFPNVSKPSRAREGFPVLWGKHSGEGTEQIDSEAKIPEEALYYSQEEIAKMPKLKDGHFRKTPDGYWQI